MPRRGWSNPHLQTVRSRIRPIKVQLPPSDEVVVTLPDGSGDRLAVQVHEADPSQPLVIIVHGLGGTAESDYVRFTTAGLLAAGFPVARVDLRGAGMSGRFLRAVITAVGPRICALSWTLSVGAAPWSGSPGRERHHQAVGRTQSGGGRRRGRFCPAGSRRRCRTPAPHRRRVVREVPATPPAGRVVASRGSLHARGTGGHTSAKSIVDFDNAITAPRNGWRDAAEYYRVNSAIRYLDSVQQPLLVIHAKDDPMIPLGPYESVDWNAFPAVRLVLTEHGGHVGFTAGMTPLVCGSDRRVPQVVCVSRSRRRWEIIERRATWALSTSSPHDDR